MCRLHQPGCAALQKLVNTIADTAGRTPCTEELLISSCSWRAVARDRHPAQRWSQTDLRARMNANERTNLPEWARITRVGSNLHQRVHAVLCTVRRRKRARYIHSHSINVLSRWLVRLRWFYPASANEQIRGSIIAPHSFHLVLAWCKRARIDSRCHLCYTQRCLFLDLTHFWISDLCDERVSRNRNHLKRCILMLR